MLDQFRKQQKAGADLSLLDLDDVAFMAVLHRSVKESNLPSLSMWLVAYKNLLTYRTLWFDAAKLENSKESPQTGDGFIRWLARGVDTQTDDLNKRRFQWVFFASILDRAN